MRQLRRHAIATLNFSILLCILPLSAVASDLEGTLKNLVSALTDKILPILAVGYFGKHIFAHIQGDPNAKHDTVKMVIATACLLGLSGVWAYIKSQVR